MEVDNIEKEGKGSVKKATVSKSSKKSASTKSSAILTSEKPDVKPVAAVSSDVINSKNADEAVGNNDNDDEGDDDEVFI